MLEMSSRQNVKKVNKHVAKKDSHDCVRNCFVAFPSETA